MRLRYNPLHRQLDVIEAAGVQYSLTIDDVTIPELQKLPLDLVNQAYLNPWKWIEQPASPPPVPPAPAAVLARPSLLGRLNIAFGRFVPARWTRKCARTGRC